MSTTNYAQTREILKSHNWPNIDILTDAQLDAAWQEAAQMGLVTDIRAIDKLLAPEAVINQEIRLAHNTKAVCTSCGREDAPTLYLKRAHGKYALLCRNLDGSGCWPQSSRNMCRHIDHEQVQCIQLAEYVICYGTDRTMQTESCEDHLGQTVKRVSANIYEVFPLDY